VNERIEDGGWIRLSAANEVKKTFDPDQPALWRKTAVSSALNLSGFQIIWRRDAFSAAVVLCSRPVKSL